MRLIFRFYDSPEAEHDILEAGLTLTIEPMINLGSYRTRILADGWTAVTSTDRIPLSRAYCLSPNLVMKY